ncbi:hypothetical protein COM04_05320 [Bacillus wiedmannii]|nr:hypothetical protein A6283_17130 [Bacillus wiedmannii]PEP70910.1 hypothetical protein CN573_27110 [Bacillus wiedmannii]PGB99968.1 hypothetical protein COM04_05320 [Bacillus wiedmannii]PGC25829.1 hypothetical protein COM23_08560 [Bacillus wiedmannii]PHB77067.1 hypothetical protein COE89_00455 [Bacillus wiedmannii]
MAIGGVQCFVARTVNKQAELLLKIDKGWEGGMRVQEIPIRKHILGGPVFLKKPILRVCKILYSFSANPVTNKNHETHARIGMYKK